MFYYLDQKMAASILGIHEPYILVTTDLLYADDVMLASSDSNNLQLLLDTVIQKGALYASELNSDKTVALRVKRDGVIFAPSGRTVKTVEQTIYIGGLI